jgi:two-component sensor histidine kinase
MLDMQTKNDETFLLFKKKYIMIFDGFLLDDGKAETFLNEGYKLGRKAIEEHIPLFSVASIHHDALIQFLEQLTTGKHLAIADKANIFFEEVLAPFSMVNKESRETIQLLSKSSIEFAIRIQEMQEEMRRRQLIEIDLEASKEKYLFLSEEQQVSLKEKEALLKEVYHRVKNNLQVITSLLHLQLDTMEDESAREAMIESAMRVKSMALVHEMLYQSGNFSEIEMDGYITKLIKCLYEIYHVDTHQVQCHITVEQVSLSIDKAIPFGLILNEIISNSLKHAFSNEENGEIKIFLKKNKDRIKMVMSDNGPGLPSDLDIENTHTLGIRLIHNLTKQLNGQLEIERDHGTTFTLTIS